MFDNPAEIIGYSIITFLLSIVWMRIGFGIRQRRAAENAIVNLLEEIAQQQGVDEKQVNTIMETFYKDSRSIF